MIWVCSARSSVCGRTAGASEKLRAGDTAVGGPEQLAQPLWLIQHGVRGIGSVLSTTRPVDNQQNATPVTTFRLVAWLRDVVAKQHVWQTPVVMRMDVEGTEYDILSDLATSGIGRRMSLYVTVE